MPVESRVQIRPLANSVSSANGIGMGGRRARGFDGKLLSNLMGFPIKSILQVAEKLRGTLLSLCDDDTLPKLLGASLELS